MRRLATPICLALALTTCPPAQEKTADPGASAAFDPADVVQEGCAILLEMQEEAEEGKGRREWPYEGVYRTNENGRRRVIPIGYRVGGTSICCLALIEAPGYAESESRRAAVRRGLEFVLEGLEQPLMQPSREDRYDVRGWGHIYALSFLLRLTDLGLVPEDLEEAVRDAIPDVVNTLHLQALPEVGGWAYAGRSAGSPFMTAPALQALFHARARGHEVSPVILDEALNALERARARSGSIAYTIPADGRDAVEEEQLGFMDKLPGAIARMPAVESTLMLAGRGDQERLAAAVEAFFEHWQELERRRKQTGTHVQPFGVAPYYFIYGHYYVAQAIELLGDDELRSRQRERLHEILAKVREEDGGWNDRVFPRSRNYGTAMGMLALLEPDRPRPIGWLPQKSEKR